MNKILLSYVAMFFAFVGSIVSASAQEQLFSNAGYPYDLLLIRTDSVEIIFIEKENGIQCRTKITNDEKQQLTSTVFVSKTKFNEEPLVSCLPRGHAKKALKRTF